jgi:ectoine hydroxylase-related dioxygenase (phytanoyl-CoA dioxygenase family)
LREAPCRASSSTRSPAYREDAKTTELPILRQNGREETNTFDANGFITVPLVNCHLTTQRALERFKMAILDVACSTSMLEALREITLEPRHVLHQVMIFEQAATKPHQDWVYLDSFPPGHMTAACTIPQMSAGDVLFWNSRLIHGSLPGSDPTKSRLSLTAHYIPHGFYEWWNIQNLEPK